MFFFRAQAMVGYWAFFGGRQGPFANVIELLLRLEGELMVAGWDHLSGHGPLLTSGYLCNNGDLFFILPG